MTIKMIIIDYSKTIKKIPCLFGRHRQSKKPLRLASEEITEFMCPNTEGLKIEMPGKELFFCERCFKILQIGHFPPYHPNCLCVTEYWDAIK